MRRPTLAVIALLSAGVPAADSLIPVAQAQSTGCTDQALSLAQGQLTDTLAYTSVSQFPVQTNAANANKWNLGGPGNWTSGFFPGLLWFTYEETLNNSWLARAQSQTASMESQDVNASDHDIGFKILGSFGNDFRITRDPASMAVIQTAAKSMATALYRPGAGVIESWPNFDSHITVIIDNMMNLELLLFAAENGGDPAWRDMAISHAVKTMQNHVRADGSTYHAVDYNPDGTVFSKFTVQGAGTETTWSRGQAWALYGFTMVYRYTKDPRFLDTAQRLADYFINNLPPDYVPYWDFSKCCTAPRDSSAAAIAAAGLLELSTFVATQADRDRYRAAALAIQTSLSSPSYLGDRLATDGVLLHGSANVPGNSGVDVSLIYGDFYFVQSCNRARTPPPAPTNVTARAASNAQISLAWSAESGPVRYSVKRSTTSGGPYTIIAPPPILAADTFIDSAPATGTNYYVVTATNASGESPNSAEVSAGSSAISTSTSLVSSAGASVYGQAVTFKATVHPSSGGTPTGTVSFFNGGSALGTASLAGGTTSLTTRNLAAGSHSVHAVYSGDTNFAGSSSPALTQTVTKATTSTSLTSSLNASHFGQSVTFSATVKVATAVTASGSVTFKDGTTNLGTVTLTSAGKASFATTKLTPGSHGITATYAGTANFVGSTSPKLTLVVSKAATFTTVKSSLNPSKLKGSVTFTANVKSSTSGMPTGSVTFRDGTTTLGTVALSGGNATFATSSLVVGSHAITAVFGGSATFNASTSATLTQTVTH